MCFCSTQTSVAASSKKLPSTKLKTFKSIYSRHKLIKYFAFRFNKIHLIAQTTEPFISSLHSCRRFVSFYRDCDKTIEVMFQIECVSFHSWTKWQMTVRLHLNDIIYKTEARPDCLYSSRKKIRISKHNFWKRWLRNQIPLKSPNINPVME